MVIRPDDILAQRDAAMVSMDRELIRRGGLAEFTRQAWHILEPSAELKWNWHLTAICEHVQAVLEGKLKRLLIAVPPGTMKSLTVAVNAPAYQWGPGNRADYRMLFASYSGSLSVRDSVRSRRLIESPWYRARWGDKFAMTSDQNQKTRFENDRTGFRVAASVGGTVTGDRGNLVACDDLLSRDHAESEAHRREASAFFWETLPSRVNDLENDAFIVIAQRLHARDTIGEILERAGDRWEKLILPMEFEPARRCVTSLGFSDPRTAEGEILHPARFGKRILADLKNDLGAYAYAGQYQQRPAPREGGLVRASWLANRYSSRGDNPIRIIQSWDCASKPKERNDPSVCLTLAEFGDRVELWDASVARTEFPDLLRRAKDLAGRWRPTVVLVEDKDAGQQLGQTLKREKDFRFPVAMVNPGQLDKFTRMSAETPLLEGGKFWLPDPTRMDGAKWVPAYVEEMTTFPSAPHDDQVDATSQALAWLRNRPKQVTAGPVSLTEPSKNIL